jgi:peptidyl-dipeptidase A
MKTNNYISGISLFLLTLFFSCNNNKIEEKNSSLNLENEVQLYLDKYNTEFQKLLAEASEAEWTLNTKIVEGDTITSNIAEQATEAMNKFTGSKENIEKTKEYLSKKDKLLPIQIKQLEAILYMAGGSPEIAAEIIKERIKANTDQTKKLYGYTYKIDGKEVSTNDIDNILSSSNDLNYRLKAWGASKEVGAELKEGLLKLRELRNKSVLPLGFSDYFHYQVSEYGMNSEEMMNTCKEMISELWPLYRELHTWARYELAKKYKQPVPEYLPAHWLPNRWGQEWSDMVEIEGFNVDNALKTKSAEWIVEQAEDFYVSLGFEKLPKSFYEKSSLYPLPTDTPYKKNNHASAWHMDNDKDVRSLMSVEPNTRWWGTTLHELGHIYYYISYTNPNVPVILRGGANRAYHEAMGSLIGLAALQKPFLVDRGLLSPNAKVDSIKSLLKEALDFVVLIPWSAGVMTDFEYHLYSKNIPENEFNKKWWELVKKYQGIVPPSERSEKYCDAATKTHINDDAAQYYDYALSNILLFQFHVYIANNILKQPPHATNYYGNKEVGNFFKKIMTPGATVNWKDHLKQNIGSDMSAKPMVEYFNPLYNWLKEENKNRTYSLPEKL